MVMAQVLFILLKKQNPDAVIDVIAPAWSQPILDRMPEVNRGLILPVKHRELALRTRFRMGRRLVLEAYDQAILLPNSLKSALVPFWAKVPRRTGWKGEFRYGFLNDVRKLDKAAYPLMVERFAALAFPKDIPLPSLLPVPELLADENNIDQALLQFSLQRDKPILSLCPGAEFGPAKRWPERHYASVAEHYVNKGWQVWLFGSKNDVDVTMAICDQLPKTIQSQVVNLAGRTQLADAIDLLSVADAVVSNDSGLMHIAAALQRNLVVVYGSSSPKFTPPLNENKAIVRLDLECSPCFKRECPLGHLNCLEQLPASHVIQALDRLAGQSIHV